jgi:Uncharacterized protein containing DHHC-type Zn finger
MAALNYVIVLVLKAKNIDTPEDRAELEEKIKEDGLDKKSYAVCDFCKVPQIIRSYHCRLCNKHIAKFHEHSLIFNKCIGAGNTLPYALFYLFIGISYFMA